jgi:4-hydroxy-tetrahydrodipicolinate synthase
MTLNLSGVWPAVSTPLAGREELDEEGLRRVVRFLVDADVDGLWMLGGGGEGVMLAEGVRRRAVEVALDELAGQIPVLVGISAEGTTRALERYATLADLAFDGAFATPPVYYACSQHEIAAFYGVLAREIPKPLVAYNNPYVVSVNIEPETAASLATGGTIAGVKDSSGNLIHTQALLLATKGELPVLQGYDNLAAASLLAGASGVVSAVASFAPQLIVDLAAAARQGDAEGAFAMQNLVLELLEKLGWDPYSDSAFIRGVKVCLEAMGLCDARVAEPFDSASDDERQRARSVLSSVPQLAPLVG